MLRSWEEVPNDDLLLWELANIILHFNFSIYLLTVQCLSKQTSTCSKSTKEAIEKGVKYAKSQQ